MEDLRSKRPEWNTDSMTKKSGEQPTSSTAIQPGMVGSNSVGDGSSACEPKWMITHRVLTTSSVGRQHGSYRSSQAGLGHIGGWSAKGRLISDYDRRKSFGLHRSNYFPVQNTGD